MCWRKYSGMLWYRERLEVKLKLLSLAVCLVLSALEVSDAEGCARDGGLQEERRDAGSEGGNEC